MTGIELKYTMLAHLELTGNLYCLLEGVSSAGAKPRALVIAHPASARVCTGSFAASTNFRTARTEARFAFAVLTTERKAA
jgi:hypothetical protein